MRTPSSNQLIFLLLVIAVAFTGQKTARASNLLVANNNDTGAGSLRQALADNASMGGGNSVIFSNTVTGTITLGSELLISNGVNIIGPGNAVLTVSGNHGHLVFDLTNSAVATISGLTIANGGGSPMEQGGAILQDSGSLTLNGCVLTGNAVPGYGGAIEANGTLTATNCTFSNNTSEIVGGAIYAPTGPMTLDGCTFSQNDTAMATGGAIDYRGSKGIIRNCTFTGNISRGGGGLYNEGTLSISNCTFSANHAGPGGGILNGGTLTIWNTIVAGNIPTGGGADCSGAFISAGYNFIGTADGSSGWGATGDQTGTAASPINPQLGSLQDNGGPTFTMALPASSPCIDRGNSGGIATDQRGSARPVDFPAIPNASGGDGSDIGAYELGRVLVVYNNNDSGAGSLRQAIADNGTLGGGNSIVFSNTVTGTITLGSELLIGTGVNIIGPGNAVLTVSGNHGHLVFDLTSSAVATISGLTIANGGGDPMEQGGAILQDSGSLTLNGCVLTGSAVPGYGGVIFAEGSLTVSNCTIFNNTAEISGGGIYQISGALTLDNCMFAQNSTGFAGGGGVYYSGSQGVIRNCTFSGNSSKGGGGVDNAGTLVISNSTFSGNSGPDGGILNTGTARVWNTIAAGNGSGGSGSDCAGTFTSAGYNFIGIADGSSGFGVTGDQTGTAGSPINAQLGPLQDNGGPTMTMALTFGSPALDKGNSGGITTDQRGAARPYDFPTVANASGGDGSDIGAFEFGSPTMSIKLVGGNAVVSWSFSYGGFNLESETDLTLNSWTGVLGAQVLVGNQITVTNGPATGNKFYRLKFP